MPIEVAGASSTKPMSCYRSMIRLMNRRVSGWIALCLTAAFAATAIVIGATGAIPNEVRAGVAFPVLVVGMLIGLRDVLTHAPVRWETLTTTLLAILGSVIVGYQSTADAKQSSALAILILSTAVIGFAVLVPLVANWLTSGKRELFVGSEPLIEKDPEAADEMRRKQDEQG
jgi:hypothetical protein